MGKRLSDRLMWLAPCSVYLLVIFTVASVDAAAPPVVEIGSRRELFVDEFIIDTLQGAQLRQEWYDEPGEIRHLRLTTPRNSCKLFDVSTLPEWRNWQTRWIQNPI